MVHSKAAGLAGYSYGPVSPLPLAVAGWKTRWPCVGISVSFEKQIFKLEVLRLKHQQNLLSACPRLSGRRSVIRLCSTSGGSKDGGVDALSSGQFDQESFVFKASRAELRSSLAKLTQQLATLSTAVTEISATIQQIARVIDSGDALEPLDTSRSEYPVEEASGVSPAFLAHEADGAFFGRRGPEPRVVEGVVSGAPAEAGPEGATAAADDVVPAHMLEQNSRAHKLAYQLQQAFVQARIDGLGKPFQLAIDDFVDTCREAYTTGIGVNELQLQLLLAEGSLSGPYAVTSQEFPVDPVMDEERRVRSSWVRLVYGTLTEVGEMQKSTSQQLSEELDKQQEKDPIDVFVNQAVKMALEEGYDLERIKLEQAYSESEDLPKAIRMMRQSQYLVVLTLEKALGQRK